MPLSTPSTVNVRYSKMIISLLVVALRYMSKMQPEWVLARFVDQILKNSRNKILATLG
jgi:hypothetical protein